MLQPAQLAQLRQVQAALDEDPDCLDRAPVQKEKGDEIQPA